MNQSATSQHLLWVTEFLRVAVTLYLLMPLIWSEVSLTRNDVGLDELLDFADSEDWRDVSRVTDDFFVVFCVAVRLHSVKRISTMTGIVWISSSACCTLNKLESFPPEEWTSTYKGIRNQTKRCIMFFKEHLYLSSLPASFCRSTGTSSTAASRSPSRRSGTQK